MPNFNMFQDQQFGGESDLCYFVQEAPSKIDLTVYANSLLDQGQEQSCTGFGTDVALDIFCKSRGMDTNCSPEFIYWNARKFEHGNMFFGEDSGVFKIRDAMVGAVLYGVASQSTMEGYTAGMQPPAEAYADAATRKLEVFERVDLFDYRSALITALAHNLAPTVAMGVSYAFAGISSDDPATQIAESMHRQGRVNPGSSEFLGLHCMDIVGWDKTLDAFLLANSWGPNFGANGTVWMDATTLIVQTLECYVPRSFAGLTSTIDERYLVRGNARHNSTTMRMVRQFMWNVINLPREVMSMPDRARLTKAQMLVGGFTIEDIVEAVAPWGFTLQDANNFLALA